METVDLLCQRFTQLKSTRAPYESQFLELSELFDPVKGQGFGANLTAGEAGDEKIWDSTPANAKARMDERIMGMVMNPATNWLGMGYRDLRDGREGGDELKEWAAKAGEIILDVLSNEETNFYTAAMEAFEEESLFGTSCKFIEADASSLIRVQAIPLSEVYIAEDKRGVVDTVYRCYKLSVRQMVQLWGQSKVSKDVKDLWDQNKPDEMIEILHCTYPRTDRIPGGKGNKNMPFACVYLEHKSKHPLQESGYEEFPYSCPRWEKGAGEVYGRGAALRALADVRVLYAMVKTATMAAQKMCEPSLMVPDDGFLGPINSGPGGLSFYRAGTQDRIEALPGQIDLTAALKMIEAIRAAIREYFYSNQFDDSSRPNMTATEAQLKYSERWKTLAAVLGRLQSEDLTPIVYRVLMILLRGGQIPPLPEGYTVKNVRFFYTGSLVQAQKQDGLQSIRVLLEGLTMAAQIPGFESILDLVDPDKVGAHIFDAAGAPTDVQRKKYDVAQIREVKAKKQQAQQALLEANSIANTAKTASQADMSGQNGLTAITGGMG